MDLSDVLGTIEDRTSGDTVTFADVLGVFGARAFGPLLLVPALIAVLPTGAIPGMSILTGSIIAIVAVQLLAMRDRPWLPRRLLDWSFSRDKLVQSLQDARGYTDRIDALIRPRLTLLVDPPLQQLAAFVCIIMAMTMFPLALLPFAVAVPGTAVGLIALGLTARDGLVVAIGYLFSAAAIGLVIYSSGSVL